MVSILHFLLGRKLFMMIQWIFTTAQTHPWHLGQASSAIKASHVLYSLCTKEERRQQLSSWPWNLKNHLFLKGVGDKTLEKKTLLLRGLLRAHSQRCNSNASLPYASYTSVHQLDQARPSLGEKEILFSITHFVPALTVWISSRSRPQICRSPFPSSLLRNQYLSTEASMNIFLSKLLTPVHS